MDDITARDFDGLIDAVNPETGESDPLGYWLPIPPEAGLRPDEGVTAASIGVAS